MPTTKKRHTCIYCGSKRVYNLMLSIYSRNGKRYGWYCNTVFMPYDSSVSRYCRELTLQESKINPTRNI